MSALLLKADIRQCVRGVRSVPKAEVAVIRSVDLIVSSSRRQQGQSLTRRPPGPASSQMMKPISGSTMISKIQSSFSTLDAPLLQNVYERPNIEDENYNPTNTISKVHYLKLPFLFTIALGHSKPARCSSPLCAEGRLSHSQ
jgi:hypothetical protein